MKILKARNGIALIAVLTIMLLTSLFIPVMFSMSDSSLAIAVKGTDRQRASYLARTVTEMSVAAFKKADAQRDLVTSPKPSDTDGDGEFSEEENAAALQVAQAADRRRAAFLAEIDKISNPKNAQYNPYGSISSETIYMLTMNDGDEEIIKYASGEAQKEELENAGFTLIGEGSCTITFDGSIHYYKTYTNNNAVEEIWPAANAKDPMNKDDLTYRETKYRNDMEAFHTAVIQGTANYTLTKKENKNLIFTSVAEVNGIKSSRTCLLVMKTEPSEEDWIVFGIEGQSNTGGNQVFVDPDKATSVVPIKYDSKIQSTGIQNQPLLVYTCVGNMVIEPTDFIDTTKPKKDAQGNIIKDSNGNIIYEENTTVGVNNSQLVLGVQPGLNTTPNNDPYYKTIDAVNYDEQKKGVQYNNFVAFGATNAIKVGMPVNLLVNPCRAKRIGDGWLINKTPNASLFKIMIFQAPVIQFTGRTDMMMSFYERDSSEAARRMSSIILTAPESTPYSYYHPDLDRTVKAGMVYFDADCYVWVIEYDDDGSSSAWTGALSETVYDRDSDFKKYKIANAGDVYYFNAEIKDGSGENVGLSLTGYFLETDYKVNYNSSSSWWNIWKKTKQELFKYYLTAQDSTFHKGDLLYLGNVNDPNTILKYPEIEDYYIVWTN